MSVRFSLYPDFMSVFHCHNPPSPSLSLIHTHTHTHIHTHTHTHTHTNTFIFSRSPTILLSGCIALLLLPSLTFSHWLGIPLFSSNQLTFLLSLSLSIYLSISQLFSSFDLYILVKEINQRKLEIIGWNIFWKFGWATNYFLIKV
jgi:hypothetical protein